jgi:hypothetical protein
MSIPAKITPISQHQHIKTTTDGWYLIYRNSNKIENKRIVQRKTIIYGTILQVFEEILKEVKPPSKDSSDKSKRIRGKKTV